MSKIFARLILLIPLALWLQVASATPLLGEARFLDPAGANILGPQPITGDLDVSTDSMSVDPFPFFGFHWITQSVELLGEGTHTRPDGFGGNITATVGPGQLGAYMVFEWSFNVLPNFMVWDVVSTSSGGQYTTIDSDGDGIPGQAFLVGPFVGFTVLYDFIVGEPPPGITVSISVEGGMVQECSQAGGSVVSLNAIPELTGGAELGGVDWFIDGESAGSGLGITPFLSLGSHNIEALASTTTGETDSDSVVVVVEDTVAPQVDVAFVDGAGNPVSSASAGSRVATRITASDICDESPATEGAVVPVLGISDGEVIKIQGGANNLKLPATALELSASATDAAGNSAVASTVLSITD